MSTATAPIQTHPTPILYRLAPIPERATSSHLEARSFWLAIAAVCFPIVVVVLMLLSPTFLNVAETLLYPVGRLLDRALDSPLSVDWAPLGFALELPLALFGSIVVHELGHFLIGIAMGFRLTSIRFGPIQISPPFRMSLKFGRNTGAAGFTSMIQGTGDSLRIKTVFSILGGPFANVLLGVVILFLSVPGWMVRFAILSIALGSLNLIPFRNKAMLSDGKRILMLLRNKAQGERLLALMQLVEQLRSGSDPESLSPQFLAKATAIRDDSPDTVMGHVFAYSAALHQGRNDEAARLLEVCLHYSSFSASMMREALRSDAAVFLARKRGRIDLAEQWLSEIPVKTEFPGQRLRAEAAILEAQGDIHRAIEKLDETEKTLATIQDPYQGTVALRLLKKWKAELHQLEARATV